MVDFRLGFFRSKRLALTIEDHGHQLLFLPPYSPDLNPVENYWAILKGKLMKIITNFQNLFDALVAVFKTI
ncbi:MAG: transposase [Candidatus Competibacteraceae bacterium]|nr:transposase [Candidatus Competibacteraceae bacterium]